MKPAFVKSASETMRGVQVGEEIIDIQKETPYMVEA